VKDPGDYLAYIKALIVANPHVVRERIEVEKYSFHWQDAVGNLLKRWDNATHHPEVVTNPHHIHDGSEENVQAHRPITAEDVLALVAEEAPK
jgi:hypothetical protein